MTKKWMLPAAITVSLTVGVAGGMYVGPDIFLKWKTPKNDTSEEGHSLQIDSKTDLTKVKQAYDLIRQYYFKEVDEDVLMSGAIQGMVSTLNDPYSVYMNKDVSAQFNQALDSSFDGIGTEIGVENDKVIIVAPYKNSPAEKAGLKPKDEIISIDGKIVKGLNVQEISMKIRGKKGTKVTLEIKRSGVSKTQTFAIKRDKIPVETVMSEVKEESGKNIGYIEISSFSKDTSKDFEKQLKALEKKDIEGLIIDVRGNPGGLLSSVEEILNELITNDNPYLQTENRSGEQTEYYTKLKEKKPYNIVALIDRGSASASEILAAALQEAGGYALIGEKSYGKGTVQQAIPMNDGSDVKLTVSKWLTPKGNWIHQKGIEPTIEIKQPDLFWTQPINIDKSLKRDMTNEQVKHAQEILKGLGYEPGREDGYYDLRTEIAVRAFQKSEGLKATGNINLKTANALEDEIKDEMKDKDNDMQLRAAIRYLLK
ncbi:S41 family peptidase [Bacillus massiliigorillae]|uniref:S41 family peptidase n=1 Tax=Bacillus massiliigorillae TaxID=1243664 RepID=UPI0003A7458E|nr:S41 family peptidase [Bacillus massiliigorillae]